ncbi:MAG: Uma2 family endonuclease [Chloroflexota bacterium]
MATPIAERLYTPEEYLALERVSETKNEFYQGEIIPMSGASREHNIIGGSINAHLYMQLRKRPTEVYQNDMRVLVSKSGLYTYPDFVVADAPFLKM